MGDERRVSGVADVELAVLQEAADVLYTQTSQALLAPYVVLICSTLGIWANTNLATKAVPNTRNALDAQVLADVLDRRLDNGLDARGLVVGDPLREVNLAGLHVADVDGVTTEEVGQDGQVAIVGELVGEQLAVDKEAEDVGEDDDGLFGGLVVLGVGEVGVDWGSQDIIIILY